MKDLAEKSFRLLMDINLKAPVIIIPQSSVSPNAIIADLGLITVENQFNVVSRGHHSLPPVIDKMDIQLTQLKLSRYKYIIQLHIVQLLNCVRLLVHPMAIACQAPLFVGIPRQEYWGGLPFLSPGNLPYPGVTCMSCILGGFFTTEPPGKPQPCITYQKQNFHRIIARVKYSSDSQFIFLISSNHETLTIGFWLVVDSDGPHRIYTLSY